MMKTLKHTLTVALCAVSTIASAQNFNPTVEVTNTYQGNASDIVKPGMTMAVPDSLLRFDLDFDYSVFEKRYEGSYSFKPYYMNMNPENEAFRGHKLYVKAGAGYSLHPEFDAVFSPSKEGPLQMSLYASHNSYFGNYHDIQPEMVDGVFRLTPTDNVWKGYDALTTAGFDGRFSWDRSILSFGAGYHGLHSEDFNSSRGYNALDFNARFCSNNTDEKYFFYDFSIAGRYGEDSVEYGSLDLPFTSMALSDRLTEGNVILHGEAGPQLDYFNRVIIGLDAVSSTIGDLFHSSAGLIAVTPRYDLETGRWLLSLGVRLEGLIRPTRNPEDLFGSMNQKKGKGAYPAVNITFNASDAVRIYAAATGGTDINTYSSLIGGNHHLTPVFQGFGNALMDNSVDVIDARAGVKGNICKRVQFDVNVGTDVVENGLLDGAWDIAGVMLPSVSYQDYNLIYANVLVAVKAGKFDLSGAFHYKEMSRGQDDGPLMGFELPAFTAQAKAVFNFNPRAYAGFTVDASTGRDGNVTCHSTIPSLNPYALAPESMTAVNIPGFVDLGFIAGYQINRKFGVWGRAGNILSETVQRNPFYAEKGVWGTVGITLTL